MEQAKMILDEVRGISPLVAGIGNQNPYALPPAYFDNFAVHMLLRIAMEEKAGADPVLNINRDNVYQVPDNYFNNLATDIVQRINAQETDAGEELERLSPLLGQIKKKNPFVSPEGYFNDFSDNVMAGVKAVEFVNEELENLSPVMLDLKDKQVYEVPNGYFDTIAEVILQKARQQRPATVIAIGFSRKVFRYAAAAVVAGLIVAAGYFYAGKTAPVTDIAKIPDQEIESFLNNNTVALAVVGTDSDSLNTVAVKDGDANADDAKDLLADVSDEELQKYVDQHAETPVTN